MLSTCCLLLRRRDPDHPVCALGTGHCGQPSSVDGAHYGLPLARSGLFHADSLSLGYSTHSSYDTIICRPTLDWYIADSCSYTEGPTSQLHSQLASP